MAKKCQSQAEDRIIGDRVDMRLVMEVEGKEYDWMNGGYASNAQGDTKFFADHLKVLHEGKNNLDLICSRSTVYAKEEKRILVPTF